jgi:hypothetical protein
VLKNNTARMASQAPRRRSLAEIPPPADPAGLKPGCSPDRTRSSLLKAYGAGGGAKATAMLINIDSTIKTLTTRNAVRRQSRRWRPLFDFVTRSILQV